MGNNNAAFKNNMKFDICVIRWIDITSYDRRDPLSCKPESVYFIQVGMVIGKCKLPDGNILLRMANPISEDVRDMDHADYFDIPLQNILYRKKIGSVTINDNVITIDKDKVKRNGKGSVHH